MPSRSQVQAQPAIHDAGTAHDMTELVSFLRSRLSDPIAQDFPEYVTPLTALLGNRKYALVMYGSCLSSHTRSESSSPDFFVVIDDEVAFYAGRPIDKFLGRHLPPNIYHFQTSARRSKYSVVSLSTLQLECSSAAKDMYLLGRFSKRLAFVSSTCEISHEAIAKIQAQAMVEVVKKAMPLLSPLASHQDLCLLCLRLSYMGDVRVEAADKVVKLYEADPEFYHRAFALARMAVKEAYTAATVNAFLKRSRRRAKQRWPKAMITASSWLDYVIDKIERTQGIKVELTPTQKKLWFIFGWKYLLKLRKNKLIR